MSDDFLERLVQDGLISADQLKEAERLAQQYGIRPDEALIKLGYVTAAEISSRQADQFGYEFTNLDTVEVPADVIALIPESVARENTVLPLEFDGSQLKVAVPNAMDFDLLEQIRFVVDRDVAPVVASRESIISAINRHYGGSETESVDSMIQDFTATAIDFTETENPNAKQEEEEENAPIVRLVNLIISEALNMRASDIHIEPMENKVRVRYRIDGILVERDNPPKRLLPALMSRIKIMARMDISEKRRPQDGRIKTRAGGKDLDLRVSILPTNHGQACVMRILDRDNIKVGIRNLGFSESNFRKFQNIIRRPNGIFLVTGPTGSGKTTTLYSSLGELNRPDYKIITAEDPVEYYLPGINQCEVKADIGLNFARIVRAMLRQAPNVILVGEIRDTETAGMAIAASLTGHLVFSTLHTNDAPSSITRLIDMGVEPFLVASSVMAVMAQRLARTVCQKCKEEYMPDTAELNYFQLSEEQIQNAKFARGRGCPNCHHSGYRGRCAIFELMVMNTTLREMTFRNEPAQNLKRQARLHGMRTLVEDCVDKSLTGKTTLMEALKLDKGGH